MSDSSVYRHMAFLPTGRGWSPLPSKRNVSSVDDCSMYIVARNSILLDESVQLVSVYSKLLVPSCLICLGDMKFDPTCSNTQEGSVHCVQRQILAPMCLRNNLQSHQDKAPKGFHQRER